jgi:hypothetical protein
MILKYFQIIIFGLFHKVNKIGSFGHGGDDGIQLLLLDRKLLEVI